MASIKDMIVIEDMKDADGNDLLSVEVQPAEGDASCVQIYQMDAGDEAQAIWFDEEGATILRDYLTKWLDAE